MRTAASTVGASKASSSPPAAVAGPATGRTGRPAPASGSAVRTAIGPSSTNGRALPGAAKRRRHAAADRCAGLGRRQADAAGLAGGALGLHEGGVREQRAVLLDEDVVAAGHHHRHAILAGQRAIDAGFAQLGIVEPDPGEGKAVDGVRQDAAALRARVVADHADARPPLRPRPPSCSGSAACPGRLGARVQQVRRHVAEVAMRIVDQHLGGACIESACDCGVGLVASSAAGRARTRGCPARTCCMVEDAGHAFDVGGDQDFHGVPDAGWKKRVGPAGDSRSASARRWWPSRPVTARPARGRAGWPARRCRRRPGTGRRAGARAACARAGIGWSLLQRHGVGGGERQRDVAAAMAEDRAGARQAGAGAQRQPAQLARVERRVGGQQHDDGALLGLGRWGRDAWPAERPRPRATGAAGQRQLRRAGQVRKHQRADRVLTACARRSRGATPCRCRP